MNERRKKERKRGEITKSDRAEVKMVTSRAASFFNSRDVPRVRDGRIDPSRSTCPPLPNRTALIWSVVPLTSHSLENLRWFSRVAWVFEVGFLQEETPARVLCWSSGAVCAIHELQFVYSFGHCFLSDPCSFVMKFCCMWFFAFFTYRKETVRHHKLQSKGISDNKIAKHVRANPHSSQQETHAKKTSTL
jgi:hypothetical protein